MKLTGLMAPAGSKARRDYDEAARRASGWGGLLSAVAEPLSYLPGPVGMAAEVAANIGEQGPMQGLMASWDVVGLPKVLRQGPKAMSISTRAEKAGKQVTDEMLSKAAYANIRRYQGDWNPVYQFSQEFPGFHISRAGKVEYEFPQESIQWTPRGKAAIAEIMAKKQPDFVVAGPIKDFVSAPELFESVPAFKEAGMSMRQGRGALYHPNWRKKGTTAIDLRATEPEGFTGFKGKFFHEGQHFTDFENDPSIGFAGAHEAIRERLRRLPEFEVLPEDKKEFYARLIYHNSYPEVRARTAQARTQYSNLERRLVPPAFETVRNPWDPKDIYKPNETLFLSKHITGMNDEEKAALLGAALKLRTPSPAQTAETLGISEELAAFLKSALAGSAAK